MLHPYFRRCLSLLVFICIAEPLNAQVTSNIGANFGGTTLSQTNSIPPDTSGAVGPNHFVEMVNGQFVIYNKQTGGDIERRSLNSFWTTRAGLSGISSFDPRIQFDRNSGRWFAMADNNARSSSSSILVAVSATADPTGSWSGFNFKADSAGTNWADFPGLGISRDWISIGHNMFSVSGSTYAGSSILTIPKNSLLSGNASGSTYFTPSQLSSSTLGTTPHFATDYNATSNTHYILADGYVSSGYLRLTGITGNVSSPTLSAGGWIPITPRASPVLAPQRGTSTTVDTGDTRFSAQPVLVNGKLWAVHSVRGGTASAPTSVNQIAWYRINPVTNVLEDSGLLPTPAGLHVYFPSIAVNPDGDIVIGYSGSDSSTYISGFYTAGRYNGSSTTNSVTWGQNTVTAAGAGSYVVTFGGTRNRWGDYSATTIDPADPGIFWTIQEYVSSTNNWRTRVTEVIPTRTNEIRWSNVPSGTGEPLTRGPQPNAGPIAPVAFLTGSNWYNGSAPGSTQHAIFSSWSDTSYQVDLPTGSGTTAINRLSLRQTGSGTVSFNLPTGRIFDLTNTSNASPSFALSEYLGTSNVAFIGDGTLRSVNSAIGGQTGGTASVIINAANWVNTQDLGIGVRGSGGGLSGTLASGGAGSLTVSNGGSVTVSGLTTIGNNSSGLTVGDISTFSTGQLSNLSGTNPVINLLAPTAQLAVTGSTNSSFSGTVSGVGQVLKSGSGAFSVTGINNYSGGTFVTAGSLVVMGQSGSESGTGSGEVTVSGTGTLAGSGRVGGATTVNSGGKIAPGDSGPGKLTLGGNLTFNSGSSVVVELNGATAGSQHDQLDVTGTVNLGNAALQATRLASYNPTATDKLFIIVNDGSDALQGTFSGLSNGASLNLGGTTGYIYYGANSLTNSLTGGNDVAIAFSPVPVPEPAAVLGIAFGAMGIGGIIRRRFRQLACV